MTTNPSALDAVTSHSPASSPELPSHAGTVVDILTAFRKIDIPEQRTEAIKRALDAHGLACYEAGSAAAAQAASGWISVDDERKPEGRKPILVAVQWMNHYEHEDGTPARQEGCDVTEGEYVPQHGERAGHFDSYAGPYDHDGWGITHWMPLPAAPTGDQA